MDNAPTQEQRLVCDMLITSAGETSKLVDTFSSWLLGGYGVGVAILMSQYDSMAKHLQPCGIRVILILFGFCVPCTIPGISRPLLNPTAPIGNPEVF